MKKQLLYLTTAAVTGIASASMQMRTIMSDKSNFRFDVDSIVEVKISKDTANNRSLVIAKTDSTKADLSTSMITQIYYDDAPDTISQGVTISGEIGGYSYVDLGLESGVKWATYNVGATKPTETGAYFAWGEICPQKKYRMDTYKWGNFYTNTISKYTWDKEDIGDGLTVLQPEDDAATANWGRGWRMPRTKEQQELIDGCTWEWTDDYMGSGVAGEIGTSKTNGNIIFLPATGYGDNGIYNENRDGNYWSSSKECEECEKYTINDIKDAAFLCFYKPDTYFKMYRFEGDLGRHYGMCVRAVSGLYNIKKKYTVVFYDCNKTPIKEQKVTEGMAATAPDKIEGCENENTQFTGWSDSSFTHVVSDLDIYPVYKHITTEKDFEDGEINGYTYVDLELPSGLKWATHNVGASVKEETGNLYAWGETKEKETYDWTTYKWAEGDYKSITKYSTNSSYGMQDDLTTLDASDDAATENWNEDWRTPTKTEMKELIEGCLWEWTDNFNDTTGMKGMIGTSKQNEKKIFLPVSDLTEEEGDFLQAVYGTASLGSRSNNASAVYVNKNGIIEEDNSRSKGRYFRAVAK